MSISRESLIALVNNHPEGLTTEQVVAQTGGPSASIRSRMSKLFCYGWIDQHKIGLHKHKALWLPKQSRQ